MQTLTKSEIQAQIDEAVGDTGSSALTVITFILTLILAALCVLFRNALLARQRQIERLLKNPANQNETVAKLEEQVRILNAKIVLLETQNIVTPNLTPNVTSTPVEPAAPISTAETDKSVETAEPPPPADGEPPPADETKSESDNKPVENESVEDAVTVTKFEPAVNVIEDTPNLEDRYINFIQELNALLLKKNDAEAKTARDEFVKRYKVKAFSCANFNKLVNDPTLAPEFVDSANVHAGDYWAYEIDRDVYAVVPNVKTYTDTHHFARAMQQVFQSNFKTGNTYNDILIDKPAIFKGKWNISEVGKLELG